MRYSALKTGMAMAIALPLLAGCSSMGSMSSFGGKQQQVAVVANIGDYTADAALAEAKGHFKSGDFGYSAALYQRVREEAMASLQGLFQDGPLSAKERDTILRGVWSRADWDDPAMDDYANLVPPKAAP